MKCYTEKNIGLDHAMLDPSVAANLLIINKKREPFVDFLQFRAVTGNLLSHTNCYRIFG
jgi:hypothetical protein